MNFRSDNVTGAAPEVIAALTAANEGTAASYGADAITTRLKERFSRLFEREVIVFPVATGTAANALAIAAVTPPWGVVYCHSESHIQVDECGAPEFFTGGAKLMPLEGEDGKVTPAAVEAVLVEPGIVHSAQPACISISQVTEAGTVYSVDEIAALGALAKRRGLALHMDGARFANAVVALGAAPAALTWRAGVDVLSFGATKNGALAAEAIVVFDPARVADLAYRRKRGGHLFSKMRFLSVQLEAYLADGLWLRNARHANAMAARLAEGLGATPGAKLIFPVQANEIFIALPEPVIAALEAGGVGFYRWGGPGAGSLRLVTAFNTRVEDVDATIAIARRTAR
jgi:threonine aldolase